MAIITDSLKADSYQVSSGAASQHIDELIEALRTQPTKIFNCTRQMLDAAAATQGAVDAVKSIEVEAMAVAAADKANSNDAKRKAATQSHLDANPYYRNACRKREQMISTETDLKNAHQRLRDEFSAFKAIARLISSGAE